MLHKTITVLEIILIICIIGFVAMYFVQSGEYRRSEAEYKELSSYASGTEVEDISFSDRLKAAGIPELNVDHESLSEINPDYVGWLSYPGLDISYPVVQGEDDEVYLHTTFEKEKNSGGCIFLEALSDAGRLQDDGEAKDQCNTFLFGHNMKNGSMFGSLKRLVNEEGLYDSSADFFLYTKGACSRYRVYSYGIVPPDSDIFYLNENEEEYGSWLKKALDMSVGDCGVETDAKRQTLTLATCSGTGRAKQRLVVHGILEDRVYTEADTDKNN